MSDSDIGIEQAAKHFRVISVSFNEAAMALIKLGKEMDANPFSESHFKDNIETHTLPDGTTYKTWKDGES